jgi:hypothetical protein
VLIAFFRKVFDADILTEIAADMAANTETEFIRVFERFLSKYGQPDSQDEDKNNVRMKQSWDPAHEDFTKLVRQIEDGARFAGYVNNPFSDTQLVKIAEKIILDTKMLKSEYKDWMRIAPAARNWNAFKEFSTPHGSQLKKPLAISVMEAVRQETTFRPAMTSRSMTSTTSTPPPMQPMLPNSSS